MDRGAWGASLWGHRELDTAEPLSTHMHIQVFNFFTFHATKLFLFSHFFNPHNSVSCDSV